LHYLILISPILACPSLLSARFSVCTLKNFPHKIEHTIQWARDQSVGLNTVTAVHGDGMAAAREFGR